MTIRDQVIEFHRAFGQPIFTVPSAELSDERIQLRFRLVREEYEEFLAALGVNEYGAPVAKPDLVALADALADLDYVIEGTRLEFGIDGGPIAAEVHRSNMAKLQDGRCIKRDDGKIQKPAHWTPPDIAGELRRQGWKP